MLNSPPTQYSTPRVLSSNQLLQSKYPNSLKIISSIKEIMNSPYSLPPKDLLFRMLDKDVRLIVKNYGVSRAAKWSDIYHLNITKESSACPRETALNSQFEKPRLVPDSFSRLSKIPSSKLSRNHSQGAKRRKSILIKKPVISAYKIY